MKIGKSVKLKNKPKETKGEEKEESMSCDVLMVATGNYSKPSMPDMDMSAFKGIILHTKDLHKRTPDLLSEKVKTVVVVGGNKSALEAAEVCAMGGKTVNWTIRKGGIGPGMLMNAKDENGKAGVERILCRFTSLAIHTLWRERGMWDRFFLSGNSKLGTKLFNWYWNKVTKGAVGDKYEKSENGKLLKPDVFNLFWSPSGISIAHKEDLKFLKVVDEGKRVKVRRTGVKSIGANIVELDDGTTVQADAIIFATGWELAASEIFSPELTAELGLPVPLNTLPPAEKRYWEALDDCADKEVLDIYPILAHPPKELSLRTHPDTPFRQFRTIVSPKLDAKNDRSIVFLGQLANTQHAFYAEISSLWTVAYLEGLLPDNDLIGNKEGMDKEIASMNAFMKRRYPGRRNIPWAVIEIRDWMDLLLSELGLRTDRKRLQWERSSRRGFGWFGWKGWSKEWFEPYEPQVYRGIVSEFLNKVEERGVKNMKLG